MNNNQAFIEKLIFDSSFQRWVTFAVPEDAIKWETFIKDNSERIESIEHAIATVKALQFSSIELSESTNENELQKILAVIQNTKPIPENDETKIIKAPSIYLRLKLVGVAVISILITIIYLINDKGKIVNQQLNAGIKQIFDQEYVNHSDTAEIITLSDHSKVLLYSKSKLSYNVFGKRKLREVLLSGQAYFKITKDSARPFIVYTDKVVTKVLGTSFIVRSFPGLEDEASVEVKTGRVSIYKVSDFKEEQTKTYPYGGITVTPDQKLVYFEQKDSFSGSLTTRPIMVHTPELDHNKFIFKATPLKTVFETLKQHYGIPIVYDEYAVSRCSLTASMEQESFYEKLNLICKVMRGFYTVVDGSVIYIAEGCKE